MHLELPETGPDYKKLKRPKSEFNPGGGTLYPCWAWTHGGTGAGTAITNAGASQPGGAGGGTASGGPGNWLHSAGINDGDDGNDDEPMVPMNPNADWEGECPHTTEYGHRPMQIHRSWLEPAAKRRRLE